MYVDIPLHAMTDSLYGREGKDLTLAAAGDAILTRKQSVYDDDQFIQLVNTVREADTSFVNLEVLLHDYDGYPAANSGGTYMRAPSWIADELRWSGFDIFAAATNHTGDFSHGGMEATMRALDTRDIPYAGLGKNLADARRPAYVDTPGGRVGVVAACSTITPGSEAGVQRPDIQGRPGLSPLHLETHYSVPETVQDQLESMSESLGLEDIKDRHRRLGFPVPGENRSEFSLLNIGGNQHLHFEKDDTFGITQRANNADRTAILDQIRQARSQSDWVFASLHVHEGVGGVINDKTVPEFLEKFARECIDAGADAFLGHGPHVLRGIEIYDDAPIFYSLGNFMMQNETVTKLPAEIYDKYDLPQWDSLPADLFDARVSNEENQRTGFLADAAFWETILPVCHFQEGRLQDITLYPVDLGYEQPRPRRGRPVLATETKASEILETVVSLSEPYGTEIAIDGEIGRINV
ncbi:CapA family protein [Haladaptatus caseinilyticus]|uniref:CapA family protein n=1 Tax=Haladaptatus caseinilyticus TaxID=2993314 RepID=UPI0026E52431|nr:CapA family protein [Haladaptatus caseinilyticus]